MARKIINHKNKLWELVYSADPECEGVMTKASYTRKDMGKKRKHPYWL